MTKLTKEQLDQIQEYIQSLPEQEREPKLKEIMTQMENETPQCPFCLMSEGKIQTTKVYDDENFMAVLEINPVNKGHAILFTKRHIKSFLEFNEMETEVIGKIIKKLSSSISKLGEGVNILYSEGKASGQRFEHFTINFIPRTKDDSVKIGWQGKPANENELPKVRDLIIENIPIEKPKVVSQPIDEERLKKEFSKFKTRHP